MPRRAASGRDDPQRRASGESGGCEVGDRGAVRRKPRQLPAVHELHFRAARSAQGILEVEAASVALRAVHDLEPVGRETGVPGPDPRIGQRDRLPGPELTQVEAQRAVVVRRIRDQVPVRGDRRRKRRAVVERQALQREAQRRRRRPEEPPPARSQQPRCGDAPRDHPHSARAVRRRDRDRQPLAGGHVVSQVLERDRQVGHRLPAPLGVLAQATHYGPFELGRDLTDETAGRLGFLREDRRHRRRPGLPHESPPARHHLVQDRAEREDVGPRIDPLALGLLRRHVGRRPDDHARLGAQGRCHRGPGVAAGRRLHQLRQAKVEHLHQALPGDHDVGRLEIAVDDARGMRGAECLADLHGVFQGVGERQPAVLDQLRETLAGHELHDDEVAPAGAIDVVNRDDVRVVERRRGFRLLLEAPCPVGIGDLRRGQHLDRDRPVQAGVTGLVDRAHAAFAELLGDLVGTQPRARRQGHGPLRGAS